MELIINADDFGISEEVNLAIDELFRQGKINSTSMLSNGIHFLDAINLAKLGLYHDKIGVHLNLTEGIPLTSDILKSTFFTDGKSFTGKRRRLVFLTPKLKKLVYNEFDSQIRFLIENGIKPTHIDSHHHYHNEPGLITIVVALAKKHHIHNIRILRNYGRIDNPLKIIYKGLANFYLVINRLNRTDVFASYDEMEGLKSSLFKPKSFEIMTHPILCRSNRNIVDSTNTEITYFKLYE
jgi:chitin disaccharide deacetylase